MKSLYFLYLVKKTGLEYITKTIANTKEFLQTSFWWPLSKCNNEIWIHAKMLVFVNVCYTTEALLSSGGVSSVRQWLAALWRKLLLRGHDHWQRSSLYMVRRARLVLPAWRLSGDHNQPTGGRLYHGWMGNSQSTFISCFIIIS